MITLTTILYEGNFRDILNDNCWFFKFNSYLITNKLLVINNIVSKELILSMIESLKNNFDFNFIFVEDRKDEANLKYQLNINNNTLGYNYTMPYFALIESVNTEFLLNVASDCMNDININDIFLLDGIDEIKNNDLCSTVMVSWIKDNSLINGMTVGQNEENTTSSHSGNPKFNYSKGFTDQFFLGKVDNFKKINYNISPYYSISYHGPLYGGECFEKRMVAHQNYNGVYNCIYRGNQYYIHGK